MWKWNARAAPIAFAAILATSLFAGCVAVDEQEGTVPDAQHGAPAPAGESDATRLMWTGYLHAGAAFEVPGHVEETSHAFRPVWSMSFQVHVEEAPRAMEVTLSWTAAVARLVLMVTEPFDEDAPTWYESPATDSSPVCFGVPTDALRPGVWRIMAHSQVAVDAALSFDVALAGGNATVVDEPSHAPAAEFPFIIAEANTPQPLPCMGL